MLSAHLAFAAGTAQAGNHAMPFPEALRALNHRDFRVFWTGQLVSLIGTWMQSVAQSWLVLQLSGSPLKLGLIGTLQFAPVLLFSVVAGSLKDKPTQLPAHLRNPAGPTRPAFLLNGLSFLVVIGALLLVHVEGTPRPRAATTVGQEVWQGLRYALDTPRIALILGLVLVVSLCVFNFTVFVPLVARNVLHLGAEGFGFLMAALGLGAVTGALSLEIGRAHV